MLEAEVVAVAGCLFEIALPAGRAWRWGNAEEGRVTVLAERVDDGRQHFRFRAEAAGEIELRFEGDGDTWAIRVRIAPERLD